MQLAGCCTVALPELPAIIRCALARLSHPRAGRRGFVPGGHYWPRRSAALAPPAHLPSEGAARPRQRDSSLSRGTNFFAVRGESSVSVRLPSRFAGRKKLACTCAWQAHLPSASARGACACGACAAEQQALNFQTPRALVRSAGLGAPDGTASLGAEARPRRELRALAWPAWNRHSSGRLTHHMSIWIEAAAHRRVESPLACLPRRAEMLRRRSRHTHAQARLHGGAAASASRR